MNVVDIDDVIVIDLVHDYADFLSRLFDDKIVNINQNRQTDMVETNKSLLSSISSWFCFCELNNHSTTTEIKTIYLLFRKLKEK